MQSSFRLTSLAALAVSACMAAARAADGAPIEELDAVLAQPVYGSSRFASASKYEQDVSDTPGTVYVRTGGEIRTQGYRTLAEVLDSMPGVHLRYDRVYTYLGVRGISRPGDYSSRVLVLIDGARVNDAIYDSATLGREFPLDVGLIDRVEYMPGPGSSLYGSNAVLGVVNVVTRGASQLPGLAATIEADSALGRKGSATWGGNVGAARVLLGIAAERRPGDDLYFAAYDRPADNHGLAVRADGERSDKLFAKAQWSQLTLSTELSDRLKRDPTGAFGVLFNAPSDSRDRYAKAALSYQAAPDATHEMFARLGIDDYKYDGSNFYAQGTPLDPIPATDFGSATWLSGEWRYVWSGWRGHRVMLGTEFQDNLRQHLFAADLAPAPQVYTDVRRHSARYSVFANDEWRWSEALRLNLGLHTDRAFDGSTTTTPRLAALWSPRADWTFKLEHGRAFREPNLSEAAYADSVTAANADLKVESLTSTEATALWRPADGLAVSATLYRLDLRDLIVFVSTADGREQYRNSGRAATRGAEFELTHVSAGGVQLRGSWSVQRATDSDTGEPLGDAPQWLGKLMLTAPGPWPGSRLGANLAGVAARRTVAGGEAGAYARLNANFTLAPPGQRWTVGVAAYNLTGRRYSDPAGPEHLEDTLAQDGRELRVQLGWSF
jgi:iron complex outermembrane receptor protein